MRETACYYNWEREVHIYHKEESWCVYTHSKIYWTACRYICTYVMERLVRAFHATYVCVHTYTDAFICNGCATNSSTQHHFYTSILTCMIAENIVCMYVQIQQTKSRHWNITIRLKVWLWTTDEMSCSPNVWEHLYTGAERGKNMSMWVYGWSPQRQPLFCRTYRKITLYRRVHGCDW